MHEKRKRNSVPKVKGSLINICRYSQLGIQLSFRMSPAYIKVGIKISIESCRRHLIAAEVLISNGLAENAIIQIEFAIEEFGRAIYLRNKLATSDFQIEYALNRDHQLKYNQAWTVIDPKYKTVYEGSFDPSVFDPAIFDTGETISPSTRINATFAQYRNNKWQLGVKADPRKLMEIVKKLREELAKTV